MLPIKQLCVRVVCNIPCQHAHCLNKASVVIIYHHHYYNYHRHNYVCGSLLHLLDLAAAAHVSQAEGRASRAIRHLMQV
jgi:hypothetical protein